MKKRFVSCLVTMLVAASALAAQEKPAPAKREVEQRFVEFKYLSQNPEYLGRAVKLVRSLMVGRNINIVDDPTLKVVVLQGSKEDTESAEAILKRFDVPGQTPLTTPRQIEVMIYLIEGLNDGESSQEIPAALKSTVAQMQSIFGYKAYRLVETIYLPGKENSRLESTGVIAKVGTLSGSSATYVCNYLDLQYKDSQKVTNISGFHFELRIPESHGNSINETSSIKTDLAIKDNQKLVLGKMMRNQLDRSIFLLLTTKVGGL